MYKYFEDKKLLKTIQKNCSQLVKELEEELRQKGLNSQSFLIGSGGRNMVMQNENGPIDFDYNLNILYCDYIDISNCVQIKELVRKCFNKVMRMNKLCDVNDSKSSLTTKHFHLVEFPDVEFSIDLGIVCQDSEGNWYRLIHQKTGDTHKDRYFWNQAPYSKDYNKKANSIKSVSYWELVREEYKNLKNMYLIKNDYNHPSFICYIEAVNNVYNQLRQKHIL